MTQNNELVELISCLRTNDWQQARAYEQALADGDMEKAKQIHDVFDSNRHTKNKAIEKILALIQPQQAGDVGNGSLTPIPEKDSAEIIKKSLQHDIERELHIANRTGSITNALNMLPGIVDVHIRRMQAIAPQAGAQWQASQGGWTQNRLRYLVDLAWMEATDSEEVPDKSWADEIISKALIPDALPQPPAQGE